MEDDSQHVRHNSALPVLLSGSQRHERMAHSDIKRSMTIPLQKRPLSDSSTHSSPSLTPRSQPAVHTIRNLSRHSIKSHFSDKHSLSNHRSSSAKADAASSSRSQPLTRETLQSMVGHLESLLNSLRSELRGHSEKVEAKISQLEERTLSGFTKLGTSLQRRTSSQDTSLQKQTSTSDETEQSSPKLPMQREDTFDKSSTSDDQSVEDDLDNLKVAGRSLESLELMSGLSEPLSPLKASDTIGRREHSGFPAPGPPFKPSNLRSLHGSSNPEGSTTQAHSRLKSRIKSLEDSRMQRKSEDDSKEPENSRRNSPLTPVVETGHMKPQRLTEPALKERWSDRNSFTSRRFLSFSRRRSDDNSISPRSHGSYGKEDNSRKEAPIPSIENLESVFDCEKMQSDMLLLGCMESSGPKDLAKLGASFRSGSFGNFRNGFDNVGLPRSQTNKLSIRRPSAIKLYSKPPMPPARQSSPGENGELQPVKLSRDIVRRDSTITNESSESTMNRRKQVELPFSVTSSTSTIGELPQTVVRDCLESDSTRDDDSPHGTLSSKCHSEEPGLSWRRQMTCPTSISACSLEALRRHHNNEVSKAALASSPHSRDGHAGSSETSSAAPNEDIASTELNNLDSQFYCSRFVLKGTLRIWGLAPWCDTPGVASCLSHCYSKAVSAMVAIAAIYPLAKILFENFSGDGMPTISVYAQIGISFFGLGGCMGSLSLRRDLMKDIDLLESYAEKHGFMDAWQRLSLKQSAGVFAMWFCVLLLRSIGKVFVPSKLDADPLVFLCFCCAVTAFAMLIFYQMHVFIVLGMMVDRFCVQLFQKAPVKVSNVALEWNLIQCILRRIGSDFSVCFMIMQTAALITLLLVGSQVMLADRLSTTDNEEAGFSQLVPMLLPPVVLALGAWALFLTAAAVTEKCCRVPSLVNSMAFDDSMELDSKQLSIVQFITNSAAGFYVKEVRLTASMAIKIMYLTGLCAFAVITKFVTDSGS